MKNRKGISLIVLVITIIVVIILAAAVILSLGENNPINDSKIASVTSSKDAIESGLTTFLSQAITKTQGTFSQLQLVTGLEGNSLITGDPILAKGAVDYKITNTVSSTQSITSVAATIPAKTKVAVGGDAANVMYLYPLDETNFKDRVGVALKAVASDAKWYLDPASSKVYLVFEKNSSYPQWMLDKNKNVDINLQGFVAKLVDEDTHAAAKTARSDKATTDMTGQTVVSL